MFDWLRGKLGFFSGHNSDADWPSLVLLLKEPQYLSPEEAVAIGRSVWGEKEPINLSSVKVSSESRSFVLLHRNLVYAFHSVNKRYAAETHHVNSVVDNVWREHGAWLAIDLPQERTAKLREQNDLGACYRFLLTYAAKLWTANCLGIFFPNERATLPNVDDLIESIRWAGRNGIDVRFLK